MFVTLISILERTFLYDLAFQIDFKDPQYVNRRSKDVTDIAKLAEMSIKVV